MNNRQRKAQTAAIKRAMKHRKREVRVAISRSANKNQSPDDHQIKGTAMVVVSPNPPPSSLTLSQATSITGDRRLGRLPIGSTMDNQQPETNVMVKVPTNNDWFTPSNGDRLPLPEPEVDWGNPQEVGEELSLIDRVPDERIDVGGGGILVVPREDIGTDVDEGDELDLADMVAQKIRKPNRREWIALNKASELTTRMLQHKPNPDGIEVEYYFVDKHLRALIREELKSVRVFAYYSFTTKTHALWIVNVTLENSWYESLVPLFGQPGEFFEKNAIRIVSDRANSRYRVRYKPLSDDVTWPSKAIDKLLGEALGASRFITTPDHPLYLDLTEGSELG